MGMSEEEKRAWELLVESLKYPRIVQLEKKDRAILAADAELSRLLAIEKRCEDVEGLTSVIVLALNDPISIKSIQPHIARAVRDYLLKGRE